MSALVDSTRWSRARKKALARDEGRCTVARLLGGKCAEGPLHVHHIHAVSEGGDRYELDNLGTTCASHHPMWEALRRTLVRRMLGEHEVPPACPHHHVTAEARAICERRLERQARRQRQLVS